MATSTNTLAGSPAPPPPSPASAPGLSPPNTLAAQPIDPGANTLSQFYKSIQNILGAQGGNLLKQGSAALNPAIAQLQKLSGGSDTAVNEATMNEQDQITDAFNRTRQMIATMPRGGGTASAEVTAPYKAIKDIAEVKSKARSDATGQLGQIGTQLAGLGLESEKAAATDSLVQHGQESSDSFANTFSTVVGAIGSLI